MMRHHQKRISLWMGMLLILIVIGAFVFLGENANHSCQESGCPICMQLEVAKELLNGLKKSVLFISCYLVIVSSKLKVSYEPKWIKWHQTPVHLKVKLLN